MTPWIGPTVRHFGATRVAVGDEEAAIEAVSHQVMRIAKLFHQWDVVVDLVKLRGEHQACESGGIDRVAIEDTTCELSVCELLVL